MIVTGHHDPHEINETHEDDQSDNTADSLCIALDVFGEQQQEGDYKLQHDEHHTQPTPGGSKTPQIPGDFVREVTRPDYEQLRKREIGPQHHEREQQLSQIMQMSRLKRAGEGFAL